MGLLRPPPCGPASSSSPCDDDDVFLTEFRLGGTSSSTSSSSRRPPADDTMMYLVMPTSLPPFSVATPGAFSRNDGVTSGYVRAHVVNADGRPELQSSNARKEGKMVLEPNTRKATAERRSSVVHPSSDASTTAETVGYNAVLTPSNCVEFVLPRRRGDGVASSSSQRSPFSVFTAVASSQPYARHDDDTPSMYQFLPELGYPATAAAVPTYEYVPVDAAVCRQLQYNSKEDATKNPIALAAQLDSGSQCNSGDKAEMFCKNDSTDGAADANRRYPVSGAISNGVDISTASRVIVEEPYTQLADVRKQIDGKYHPRSPSEAAASSTT